MKRNQIKENKKIIVALVIAAVVFALAAIIIHQATRLTNESYANCAMGDVNGDGYINAFDALLVIKNMSDSDLLFENQKLHADVNKDGKVDSGDALILLRYSCGAIKSLSVEDNYGQSNSNSGRHARFEDNNAVTTVQIMNEWDNGDGTHSYQLSLTVKGTDGKDVDMWLTSVSFSSSVDLYKNWDCKCKSEGDKVLIKGSDVPGDTAAVCGFIVKAPQGLTINKIRTEVK